MKYKIICLILCVAATLAIAQGCKSNENSSETTSDTNTVSTTSDSGVPTTKDTSAGESTTEPESEITTTEAVTKKTTKENTGIEDYGYSLTDGELYVEGFSVKGLPITIKNGRNSVTVEKAGILNGNSQNPMFLLVKNTGEDDLYSGTVIAEAGGKTLAFSVAYLPAGASVWIESSDNYVYSSADNFTVKNNFSFVSSTDAGIPIDRAYNGILEIYAGVRNGARGVYVKNVSGRTVSEVVIKYRAKVGSTGLFSAPFEMVIKSFPDGNSAFKANSYIYDVEIEDVQIKF